MRNVLLRERKLLWLFVDISVFGKSTDAQCTEMTKEICRIFEEELSIPADKLYVKYNGSTQWGWNNMNF